MNEIKFKVTSDISLSVFVYDQEADIHLYSLGSVLLKGDSLQNIILFSKGPIFLAIDDLVFKLRALLAGKLELDAVFLNDGIGYSYNEFYQRGLQEPIDKDGVWLGFRYSLWFSGKSHTATRLYSYHQKFFIEITPCYPWDSDYEPKEGDGYIPYDEFMKTYKPIALFELSGETVKDWLGQAERLVQIMHTNGM